MASDRWHCIALLCHRPCNLDRLNNSKLVPSKREADIANEREEEKKQTKKKNNHAVLVN